MFRFPSGPVFVVYQTVPGVKIAAEDLMDVIKALVNDYAIDSSEAAILKVKLCEAAKWISLNVNRP